MARQIMVGEGRGDLLGVDGLYGRPTDIDLSPFVAGRPNNSAGGHLRLKNRGYRLRMAWETCAAPTELRRVHSREHNRRDMHFTLIVNELRTDRVRESHDCVLGPT